MNFFVIGDEDTVLGFSLVGVQGRAVSSLLEAREGFKAAVSTPDVGIIIITERIARQIREDVDRYVYETTIPLIIEIPDRKGPVPGVKTIPELIKEAVGIKV